MYTAFLRVRRHLGLLLGMETLVADFWGILFYYADPIFIYHASHFDILLLAYEC